MSTTTWRPVLIGPFYYATKDGFTSKRNFMMRDACLKHCVYLAGLDA